MTILEHKGTYKTSPLSCKTSSSQTIDGLSWVGASWEHGQRLAEEEYKLWSTS